MSEFPWQAFLEAVKTKNQNQQQMMQGFGGSLAQVGQDVGQGLQQRKKAKDLAAFQADLAKNPAFAGISKGINPENFGSFAGLLKNQQTKANEAVPFDQAVSIAGTAGNESAAAPFIQTATAQGRDYLNKQEMSDMFKTITTSASKERGKYFEGMLGVNKGRLDLQRRQAAFGGQFGKNQLSLNTALGHVDTASKAFDAVKNTNTAFLNVPINKLKTSTNDPNIIKLGISLNALQGELANVFKGSGGTDQEIAAWSKYLNENLTPAQAIAAMQQVGDLLDSRLSGLGYQQEQVGGDIVDPRKTLSPKAKAVIQGLKNKSNANDFSSMSDDELRRIASGGR